MVPDIALHKRQQQANSLDSSATPSPVTDSSATNSPITPVSFSPTPSPESRSSSSVSSHLSNSSASYRYGAHSDGASSIVRLPQYGPHQPPAAAAITHNLNVHHRVNEYSNGFGPKPRSAVASSSSSSSSSSSWHLTNAKLPIHFVKNQLLKNIQQNESIIIIGETGCGKTTQLPKFIYEFYGTRQYQQPLCNDLNGGSSAFSGLIGITQPRRVAAISIATRVAQEMNSLLGETVGYTIRFEDQTSSKTSIKYMTDGILLREAISDPLLSKYGVIILDEAHERTVHTDVLFGVVKKAQRLRRAKRSIDSASSVQLARLSPLKLIIMSATMDVDHFSQYFNGAPVYYIVGRTFPIETFYMPEKQSDYVSAALTTIFQIHQQEDELENVENKNHMVPHNVVNGFMKEKPIGGDIIVFCTGQDEIESMIKTVTDLSAHLNSYKTRSGHAKTLKAYPLYAALPTSMQQKIFTRTAEDCFRRVIFATNIAETSITIPNIRFVIDTGKVKSRVYLPKTGLEVMQVEDISRAQACQRSGRAGRLAPGQCYRLYTKKDFKAMKSFPIPEIQKCNLSNVLLQLLAIGIHDPVNFDYIDRPSSEHIDVSIRTLLDLKAIECMPSSESTITTSSVNPPPDAANHTTKYQLTDLGRQMVSFPVDPRYSALIIASKSFRCTDEILIIIAMLSVDSVFFVPPTERDLALKMHRKFASSEGDLIKLLNVYRRYKESKQSREWCNENFLRPVQLKMAVEIRNQLAELCHKAAIPVVACGETQTIRRCLAVAVGVGVGLGANIAALQRDGNYQLVDVSKKSKASTPQVNKSNETTTMTTDDNVRTVFLHPSSCLFGTSSKPGYLLFAELVRTSKAFMRNVCIIDDQWLLAD